MNKRELIESISKTTGQSIAAAGRSLDAALNAIRGALRKEEGVTIASFGSFSLVKRKARKGRNPRTGEEIKIPASRRPRFTPSRTLKDLFGKK